jgi:hypothetical protein
MTALAVATPEEITLRAGWGSGLAVLAGDMRNGLALAMTSGIGRTGRWPCDAAVADCLAALVVGVAAAIVVGRLDMPVSTDREEQPAIRRRKAGSTRPAGPNATRTQATRWAGRLFTIDPP